MSRELLQHALNALENFAYHGKAVGWADVATSIRAHLTRPEPMPIAWANINKHGDITRTSNKRDAWAKTPLYAAQPTPAPHPDEFVCPYCFDQGAAPVPVPPGWKLVPVEPTYEMIREAQIAQEQFGAMSHGGVYRVMLEAAPPPPGIAASLEVPGHE